MKTIDKTRSKLSARLLATVAIAGGIMLGATAPTVAEDAAWPKGNVRMITPIKPGGGTDAVARLVASELQDQLGRAFVVVNQPAGGGGVAVDTVLRAKKDGATLFFFNSAIIHRAHTGLVKASPSEDFTTLAFFPVKGSYCFVVDKQAPYETLADLISASKAAPDSLTFGVQLKSGSHFGGALIQRETSSAFRFVQGGGDSDLTVAIEGGHIDTGLVSCSTAVQHRDADKLKILATVSRTAERDERVPDIPTINELGYPDVSFSLDFLLLGPKDMDPALAKKINMAFSNAVADPEIAAQLTKMRIPMSTLSIEDSTKTLRSADQTVAALARELGFE